VRRVLYDRAGKPQLYATGAGVLYTLHNEPVGFVRDEQVVSAQGGTLGWFDGSFFWDASGKVLGFVKGAAPQGGLALPRTEPLKLKPQPTPAPFHPLLTPKEKPALRWEWSDQELAGLFGARYA